MKNTKTIAERLLNNLLVGDGCRRTTRLGVDRERLVRRICVGKPDLDGDSVTYTFDDGSQIQAFGWGWDTPEGWAANA